MTKKEIAHRICTELREPFAELLLDILEQREKGGYSHNIYTLERCEKND